MEINGYKALNSDMTDNCGRKFEEGKTYHVDGELSFAATGNGFQMCKRMEDSFRYIKDENSLVASVTGFGEIAESFDDHYEYYDLYVVRDIKINHLLSREEVINNILQGDEYDVCRFIITGFKLTDEEVELIRTKFGSSDMIDKYIDYYVYGNKHAFDDGISLMKKRNVNNGRQINN